MTDGNFIGHVYDIQGFSVHDGPGIRTTVFLMGCPLSCLWCHSPESQQDRFQLSYTRLRCVGVIQCGRCISACPRGAISASADDSSAETDKETPTAAIDRSKCDNCLACVKVCYAKALQSTGYEITVDEAFARILKDKRFYKHNGGVTISGGEPMEQFEFTLALAKKCGEDGISVCLDTTGYAPSDRYERILPYVDLFLYDLKHMDSKKSKRFTGVPNELILENAKFIAHKGGKFQIRVPVIPKLNDDTVNLTATAQFIASLGNAVQTVQLLPYHKMGASKYERIGEKYKLTNIEPPSDEQMQRHLSLMKSYGLNAVIH